MEEETKEGDLNRVKANERVRRRVFIQLLAALCVYILGTELKQYGKDQKEEE